MDARLGRYDKHGWRRWVLAGVLVLSVGLVACSGADSSADEEPRTTAPGMAGGGESEAASSGGLLGAQTGSSSMGDGGFPGVTAADQDNSAGGAMPPAPAETGASAGGGNSAAPIADVLGRQVIRNGSMDLRVEDVAATFDQARGVIEQAEGYLSGSTFTGHDDSQWARFTARVPSERFDQVVADLRKLAIKVDSVSTGSQDVTEEYTDLEASLRNLKAVEQQYLTLLGEASDIGEILQVQDRLNGVRYELERVQGRLNLLDNQTSLATLEVSLYPDSVPMAQTSDTGFRAEVREAWESSLEFMGNVGTGVVVALVWSWWLIPVLIVAAILLRRVAGRLVSATRRPEGDRVDTPEGAA